MRITHWCLYYMGLFYPNAARDPWRDRSLNRVELAQMPICYICAASVLDTNLMTAVRLLTKVGPMKVQCKFHIRLKRMHQCIFQTGAYPGDYSTCIHFPIDLYGRSNHFPLKNWQADLSEKPAWKGPLHSFYYNIWLKLHTLTLACSIVFLMTILNCLDCLIHPKKCRTFSNLP